MRNLNNPMSKIYYYVPKYGEYFEYVEHRGSTVVLSEGALLMGGGVPNAMVFVPETECRRASYNEIREFYNS